MPNNNYFLQCQIKKQSKRLVTFETFGQSDEEIWPDKHKDKDNKKDNEKDNPRDL